MRIAIAGDPMLDIITKYRKTRVSPEDSSIPIVEFEDSELCSGGAANVSANLISLGYEVFEAFPKKWSTKNRIYLDGKQVMRIDQDVVETESYNLHKYIKDIEEYSNMGQYEVVFSDYNKGAYLYAKDLIEVARNHTIPVIVNAKPQNISVYKGATIIQLNTLEFEQTNATPKELIEALDIERLVITRGKCGVEIHTKDDSIITTAPELGSVVADVVGAGDCVLAAIATCVSSSIQQMAEIAIKAGTAAVSHPGTYKLKLEDIS